MAVYTRVTEEDLGEFLHHYDLPPMVALKGIADGTENTTYLLLTTAAPYILTLYEKRAWEEDLPFLLEAMRHLADRGVPCARPVCETSGTALRRLCNRPAALTTFLPGASIRLIQPFHCREVGRVMARLHTAAEGLELTRPNPVGVGAWTPLLAGVAPGNFRPGLVDGVTEELMFLHKNWPDTLPRGLIHADLFPDNVLFREGRVTGVIDFGFACADFFSYDLAIGLNAWCFEDHASFNVTKARQFLAGYQEVRPLEEAERMALPVVCRGAAVRFLLTRLLDWPLKPPGVRRDPEDYVTRLRFHQQVADVSAYGLEPG